MVSWLQALTAAATSANAVTVHDALPVAVDAVVVLVEVVFVVVLVLVVLDLVDVVLVVVLVVLAASTPNVRRMADAKA